MFLSTEQSNPIPASPSAASKTAATAASSPKSASASLSTSKPSGSSNRQSFLRRLSCLLPRQVAPEILLSRPFHVAIVEHRILALPSVVFRLFVNQHLIALSPVHLLAHVHIVGVGIDPRDHLLGIGDHIRGRRLMIDIATEENRPAFNVFIHFPQRLRIFPVVIVIHDHGQPQLPKIIGTFHPIGPL